MDYILKDEFLDLKKYNIDELGIKSELIIENSAMKVIKNINLNMRNTFAIICGISNNGAIGLAIARLLKAQNKFVNLYILDSQKEASDEFRYQNNIIKSLDIDITYLETIEDLESLSSKLNKVNTIIDAITGYEYDDSFSGTMEHVINSINRSRIYTISVDIPSGMDYDTGKTTILSINCDIVVTFCKAKNGLLRNNRLNKFDVRIENIGLFERGKDVRYKAY